MAERSSPLPHDLSQADRDVMNAVVRADLALSVEPPHPKLAETFMREARQMAAHHAGRLSVGTLMSLERALLDGTERLALLV